VTRSTEVMGRLAKCDKVNRGDGSNG